MFMPVAMCVLVFTAVTTFLAFARPHLKARLMFDTGQILRGRQYERMITSGLIHGDVMHFLFNAYSFCSFAGIIEAIYGAKVLLLIYVGSILGGSILSLIIHRHHEHRALGASGGVCGLIFASVFLLPGNSVRLFMIPVPVPAYAYVILFLVYSFVSHRRGRDNIGHDAHLGGAVAGLLVAVFLYPQLVFAAPWMLAIVTVLAVVILLAMIYDPAHLLEHHLKLTDTRKSDRRAIEYEDNHRRNKEKAEIDRLLDKVAKNGAKSLSGAEQRRLKALSMKIYGTSQQSVADGGNGP
jgi:membrane associated rhomboid family serine protease